MIKRLSGFARLCIVVLGVLWLASAFNVVRIMGPPPEQAAMTRAEICERYSYTFVPQRDGTTRHVSPDPACLTDGPTFDRAASVHASMPMRYWGMMAAGMIGALIGCAVILFVALTGKSAVLWVRDGFQRNSS